MSLQIPHREKANGAGKDTKAIILVSMHAPPERARKTLSHCSARRERIRGHCP